MDHISNLNPLNMSIVDWVRQISKKKEKDEMFVYNTHHSSSFTYAHMWLSKICIFHQADDSLNPL